MSAASSQEFSQETTAAFTSPTREPPKMGSLMEDDSTADALPMGSLMSFLSGKKRASPEPASPKFPTEAETPSLFIAPKTEPVRRALRLEDMDDDDEDDESTHNRDFEDGDEREEFPSDGSEPPSKRPRIRTRQQAARHPNFKKLLDKGVIDIGDNINLAGEEGYVMRDGWIEYGVERYPSALTWCAAVAQRLGFNPTSQSLTQLFLDNGGSQEDLVGWSRTLLNDTIPLTAVKNKLEALARQQEREREEAVKERERKRLQLLRESKQRKRSGSQSPKAKSQQTTSSSSSSSSSDEDVPSSAPASIKASPPSSSSSPYPSSLAIPKAKASSIKSSPRITPTQRIESEDESAPSSPPPKSPSRRSPKKSPRVIVETASSQSSPLDESVSPTQSPPPSPMKFTPREDFRDWAASRKQNKATSPKHPSATSPTPSPREAVLLDEELEPTLAIVDDVPMMADEADEQPTFAEPSPLPVSRSQEQPEPTEDAIMSPASQMPHVSGSDSSQTFEEEEAQQEEKHSALASQAFDDLLSEIPSKSPFASQERVASAPSSQTKIASVHASQERQGSQSSQPEIPEIVVSAPQEKNVSSVSSQSQSQEKSISSVSSQSQSQEKSISPISSQSQSQEKSVSSISSQSQSQEKSISSVSSQSVSQSQEKSISPVSSQSQGQEKNVSPLSSQSQSQEKRISSISSQSQSQEKRISSISSQSQSQEKSISSLSSQSQSQEKSVSPLSSQSQSQEKSVSSISSQSSQEKIASAVASQSSQDKASSQSQGKTSSAPASQVVRTSAAHSGVLSSYHNQPVPSLELLIDEAQPSFIGSASSSDDELGSFSSPPTRSRRLDLFASLSQNNNNNNSQENVILSSSSECDLPQFKLTTCFQNVDTQQSLAPSVDIPMADIVSAQAVPDRSGAKRADSLENQPSSSSSSARSENVTKPPSSDLFSPSASINFDNSLDQSQERDSSLPLIDNPSCGQQEAISLFTPPSAKKAVVNLEMRDDNEDTPMATGNETAASQSAEKPSSSSSVLQSNSSVYGMSLGDLIDSQVVFSDEPPSSLDVMMQMTIQAPSSSPSKKASPSPSSRSSAAPIPSSFLQSSPSSGSPSSPSKTPPSRPRSLTPPSRSPATVEAPTEKRDASPSRVAHPLPHLSSLDADFPSAPSPFAAMLDDDEDEFEAISIPQAPQPKESSASPSPSAFVTPIKKVTPPTAVVAEGALSSSPSASPSRSPASPSSSTPETTRPSPTIPTQLPSLHIIPSTPESPIASPSPVSAPVFTSSPVPLHPSPSPSAPVSSSSSSSSSSSPSRPVASEPLKHSPSRHTDRRPEPSPSTEDHDTLMTFTTTTGPSTANPVILASGLSSHQLEQIKLLAQQIGGKLVGRFSQHVTHLVAVTLDTSNDSKRLITKRTTKYCQALVRGSCWIVGFDWILQSTLRRSWVAEEPFEIDGDESLSQSVPSEGIKGTKVPVITWGAPRKSRLAHISGNKLFKGHRFVLLNDFGHSQFPARSEIVDIIQYGGGNIIVELPANLQAQKQTDKFPRTHFIVLCDPQETDISAAREVFLRSGLHCLSITYLFDSISHFCLLDDRPFRILSPALTPGESSDSQMLDTQCSLNF